MRCANFYGYTVYEDGTIYNYRGKQITVSIHDDRYVVKLFVNGKRRNFTLARTLYWLFVEKFDYNNKDLCVSFKDGNKLNIALDNLILIHRKDLIQGEKHKISKLSDKIVEQIRNEYYGKAGSNQYDKTRPSLNDLAKKYNVSKSNIAIIIKKKGRNEKSYKLKSTTHHLNPNGF